MKGGGNMQAAGLRPFDFERRETVAYTRPGMWPGRPRAGYGHRRSHRRHHPAQRDGAGTRLQACPHGLTALYERDGGQHPSPQNMQGPDVHECVRPRASYDIECIALKHWILLFHLAYRKTQYDLHYA